MGRNPYLMYRLIKHANIRSVKNVWSTLCAHNTRLTPYQEYSYCSIVDQCSIILKWNRFKNIIYEVRNEDNQTVIIVPLHLKRTKTENIAYSWGEKSQAGHLDFIYKDQIQTEAFLSAMKLISRDIGNVRFVLNRVAEQSRLNELIQTVYGPTDYTVTRSTCVQIPIATTYNDYLASLSRQVKQNLRTSFNRLKTDNRTYEVQTYVNQPVPTNMLAQLFKIYWKRLSDKAIDIGANKYLPVFLRMRLHPTTVALKRLNNVYYSIIYIDNMIAGFSAGLISRQGKIILPYFNINSTFARYSPGGILITETIKYLSENYNYKYFDLSRGTEKYKYTYGGIEHYNFNYEILRDRCDQ